MQTPHRITLKGPSIFVLFFSVSLNRTQKSLSAFSRILLLARGVNREIRAWKLLSKNLRSEKNWVNYWTRAEPSILNATWSTIRTLASSMVINDDINRKNANFYHLLWYFIRLMWIENKHGTIWGKWKFRNSI